VAEATPESPRVSGSTARYPARLTREEGTLLGQKAPEAFAEAVMDVDTY
jgi:hypothetical protein